MTNSSIADPLVGHALEGRYEITSRLARGGMATVYRAVDRRLDRTVAVKVMHEGLGDDQDFATNFDREARAAAHLAHPNIVSVFDQGNDFGRPFIVMELVEGSTLRRLISREAPLIPLRALDLIDPVLAALAAAHESGLIHRDVKPENVLISRRGQLKVADFGLARAVTSQSAAATQSLLIGTVSYLPPELVEHGHADTRSDVYSAGIMLFEMLTGRKPHTGDSPIQVAYAHVHKDVPKPSSWIEADWRSSLDGIPPYLDALVGAATSRDPDKRPRDARAFLDCVRRARKALSSGIMHDPHLTMLLADPNAADDTEPVDIEYTPTRRAMAALASSRLRSEAAADPTPSEADPADGTAPAAVLTEERRPTDGPGAEEERVLAVSRDAGARGGRPPADGEPDRHAEEHDREWADSGAYEIARAGRQRRTRRALVSVLLVLLVVLAGTGAWWAADGRYVAAPTVTSLTQPEAAAVVKAAGLEFATTEEYSETVPAGEVIATVPGPGEDIARGATLTAVLSKGQERYAVPAVVGKDLETARAELVASHLAPGTTTEEWSESVPAGDVMSTATQEGTKVKPETPIDLVVSKGREPITVTNWYNRDGKDAIASLADQGLKVVTTDRHSDDVAAGKVVGQTPSSGTLYRGDTVMLSISQGPEQVAVPDVTGKPVAEAEAEMTGAGFTTTTEPVEVNYLGLGYVARSSVDPGATAPKGSAITLFLV